MLKYLANFFLTALLLSACVESTQKEPALTYTTPESVGVSSDRLANIDQMLSTAVTTNEIPGVVALVARDGKIVYHKAFGMADAIDGTPMDKTKLFRIASQTKAITCTATMMLWEEGLFMLDDPIGKYLSEFSQMGLLESFNEADSSFTLTPIDKPITIRHLLTHTSGLGYGFIDGDDRFRKIFIKNSIIDAFTTKSVVLKDNMQKLAKLPLHHLPGEKWTYGEGIDVLGYLVETLSGMPLDQFFKTRIFEPLGMNDTYFYLPENKADRLVTLHKKEDGNWIKYPTSTYFDPDFPRKGAKSYFAGGAGLTSSPLDYVRFLQMYLNEGELDGNRLLSPTTVKVILSNQIGDLRIDTGLTQGLAFGLITENGGTLGGRGSAGTFEWGGYFNTSYFADPKTQTIGILMKQAIEIPKDDTGWKFRQLVGASIVE